MQNLKQRHDIFINLIVTAEVGVLQNSLQVSQVAQMRNLRCALCLFFSSCAICVALYVFLALAQFAFANR